MSFAHLHPWISFFAVWLGFNAIFSCLWLMKMRREPPADSQRRELARRSLL